VIRAIDLLVSLKTNVIVAMTVTRENRSDIPNMVSRFGSRLALQPLFKAGRGQDKGGLSLTGLEYYDALASVDGVAPMGMIARTLESIRGRGVRRCALAEREISISETGDVYPCQLLHAEEFKAGNIREISLAEIYYESPVFNRLRGITVDTLGKCSTCQLRYICGGACRARDFYEVGSIEEVGEFCEYEREAFINGIFESVELQPI
jgi:radical SAM protein with 4Fe4S-binding SPASM domain